LVAWHNIEAVEVETAEMGQSEIAEGRKARGRVRHADVPVPLEVVLEWYPSNDTPSTAMEGIMSMPSSGLLKVKSTL
jgi:hypothetical protein